MENIFKFFDSIRVQGLRWSLRTDAARAIFAQRSRRLLALYFIAVAIFLPLCLLFPLWVLVIGPLVWGLPHIFASFRFVHFSLLKSGKATDDLQAKSFRFLASVWLLVTFYRVGNELQLFRIQLFDEISFLPEILSMAITAIGLSWLYRFRSMEGLKAMAVLLPVAALSWLFPIATVGALLILHNWVAFFYWYRSTQTKRDRVTFGIAFFIFIGIHALVWLGAFDLLYKLYAPLGNLEWAGLDYEVIGKAIAPWTESYTFWFHSVILYAFGQSIHYFIWMKAIPDHHLQSENPSSFRQAWALLRSELGQNTARALCFAAIAFSAVWILLQYPQARALYFAVAAYHGYMEISAMGFSFIKTKPA